MIIVRKDSEMEETNEIEDDAQPAPGKLALWFEELRAPFFTASIVPILLGAIIAWSTTGTFIWSYFLLTLILTLLH